MFTTKPPFKSFNIDVDIQTDRNAVVAVLRFQPDGLGGERLFVTGSSKREQGDVFDRSIGEQIALGRALQELGREMIRTGNKRASGLPVRPHGKRAR